MVTSPHLPSPHHPLPRIPIVLRQAAEALDDPVRAAKVAGKAYFITNQDPREFWGMMGDVCEGLGYKRPYMHLPVLLILFVAALFEYVIRPLLRPIKDLNSDFTVNRCAGG